MAVSGDCQLRRMVVMSSTCGGSSCGSVSLVAPSLQRWRNQGWMGFYRERLGLRICAYALAS
ncbi:BnaA08g06700D [Brassica napus]|uniref:BnaA08g06700D protein n=2 Tax=Brassica TaxID=3705 RepID=A0A078I2A9_BRANA|nr:BnaA08g06700D [Brassica napus]